ncbi:MAG: putative Centromere-associated protein E, partial [Streblomastix strix]
MEKRISVFVRVKPVDGVQQWEVDPSHTEINSLDKKDKFRFDHIFGRTSTQYEVYGRIQPIVESFLLGYNGIIMAYGQTGSGKTFTTFGNTNNPGIVRQAAGEIFERIQQDSSKSYSIRVSYLEIYNEELKDLINENNKPKVRENAEGFFVSNLDERNVKNQEELMHELNLGDEIRHTRATAMNSLSSRSHALFRITLITESQVKQSEEDGKTSLMQKDEQQNSTIKTKSILYFVDLAGSERLSQTKAEGEAQKEGCNINLSLLTLRKVIQALSINSQKDGRIENNGINSGESQTTKQSHINYRDSKLTMVLKENLQGNSQTAIIVTINPLELYTETTKGSLQFAETAQHVRTIVRINEIIDDKRRIEDLLQECKRLRRLLDQVKSVDNIQQGLLIQSQNYGNGQQSFGIPGQRNTFGIGILNIPKKRKVSIYGNGNIQDNEDEGFNRPPKPTNAQM